MKSGWGKPSVEKRRAYIKALQSRPRPLTTQELGHLMGVCGATALQMLYAIERDGVVRRVPGGGKNIAWELTGEDLPAAPASTAKCADPDRGRYDHTALTAAMKGCPL